jgi:16S rRNA (cytosine1402-N4)-methyltransferase
MSTKHISVLLNESISSLNLKDDSLIVDCTLGYGGHSSNILKRINKGYLFAFDQDSEAIRHSTDRLSAIGTNFTIIKSNFVNLKEELEKRNITKVDGFLFDLGVSSPQLDEKERGFSYHEDAKLDMRMDLNSNFSARDVINTYDEKHLADIIFRYGEEKYAKSIARNIVKDRMIKPIETTFELVDIIKKSMPMKERVKSHPARRTFQAIRIEVNHELDILEESLENALSLLNIGGRLVVITFHSLEDRIVKDVFKKYTTCDDVVKGLPNIPDEYLPNFVIINKKSYNTNRKRII